MSGCTAFCAANRSLVLVGNNEDGDNPFTRVWFLPAEKGKLGRMYVGFDNLAPQGGMNERGLWFDAFATAPLDVVHPPGKPAASLVILDEVMSRYATVEEVIRHYESHDRSFLRSAVLMYADASGYSVVIEPGAIIRKKGRWNRKQELKRVARTAIALDPKLIADCQGTYLIEPGLPIRVQQERGRLIMDAEGFPKTELFAESPDRFFSKVMTERLGFTRNAAGRVDGLVLYVDDGREFAGKRQ